MILGDYTRHAAFERHLAHWVGGLLLSVGDEDLVPLQSSQLRVDPLDREAISGAIGDGSLQSIVLSEQPEAVLTNADAPSTDHAENV